MRVLEVGNTVFQLRFLPDNRRVLVGTARSGSRSFVTYAVWPLAGGAPVRLRLADADARGLAFSGNTVAVHPDGETFYLVRNRRLLAFRTATGREQPVPPGVKGHEVILSPAGDRLVVADWGGAAGPRSIRLFMVTLGPRGGQVVRRAWWPDELPHLAGFLPDGNRFVTIGDSVRILSFGSGQELAAGRYPANHVTEPQISPDGRELGVMAYLSTYFYDLATLGEPRRIAGHRSFDSHGVFAYHPGGKTVAVVHGAARQVVVYDRATLERVQTWNWKLGPLASVAFSPDGTLGAAGSRGGRVVVWDVDE